MLAVEIAQYLEAHGLVTFDTTGIAGDCFIAAVPSAPDECVIITPTGGVESDVKLGYDTPTLQVRVRGTEDPRPAFARAAAIYGALHGLGNVTLLGGTWLVGCTGIQSAPVWMGQDENHRHEYTMNFRLEVRAKTTHRE